MTRLALLALVLAGCEQEEEMFPISPGGGGGPGGTTRRDAAVDASGEGGGPINGRVCLVATNLRRLADCAATGAGGLTVTLGTAMATTGDNGTFTIDRPASTTNLAWSVSGGRIVSSLQRYGSITTLPAIDRDAYQAMVAANNVASDDGAMMVRVTRAGAAVPGATVTATPAPPTILYDANSDDTWDDVATGTSGVAWMPSVTAGNVSLTVTASAMQTNVTGVPVAAGAITFVFAEIP